MPPDKIPLGEKIVLAFAFVILLVNFVMCSGCTARPATVPPPSHIGLVPVHIAALAGAMACDVTGAPTIVLNPNVLGTRDVKYIIVHESTHVEQAARDGGCRAFIEHYLDDPTFRFDSEAEAYCASYHAMQADSVATHQDWTWLVETMRSYAADRHNVVARLPCTERATK